MHVKLGQWQNRPHVHSFRVVCISSPPPLPLLTLSELHSPLLSIFSFSQSNCSPSSLCTHLAIMSADSTTLFVGVDGGGTKTAICVINHTGTVVSELTVGGSNPNSSGEQEAKKHVIEGITQAVT